MVTYYDDNDSNAEKEKTVKVSMSNAVNPRGIRLEYYLLDENNDCALTREEIFTANEFSSYVKMTNFSTYLFKIIEL